MLRVDSVKGSEGRQAIAATTVNTREESRLCRTTSVGTVKSRPSSC